VQTRVPVRRSGRRRRLLDNDDCSKINCQFGCCDLSLSPPKCAGGMIASACGSGGEVCQVCTGAGKTCYVEYKGGGYCVGTGSLRREFLLGCCDYSVSPPACRGGDDSTACGDWGELCQGVSVGACLPIQCLRASIVESRWIGRQPRIFSGNQFLIYRQSAP